MANEPFEPTQDEIAAEAKRIRESGFTLQRTGKFVEPWDDVRYAKASGESLAPYEFQMIAGWAPGIAAQD